MTQVTLALPGCTPEPLMSYLKALGVFRLIAEQADPSARLSWQNGSACLSSSLDADALSDFFLDRYRPTPILAPWNGGSGFYDGGTAPVEAIAGSTTDRLQSYRETIQRVRGFVPQDKPKDADKQRLLEQSRARLADDVVTWLDVCFVLGEDKVSFFPLLGTGGNDGRLDFTNNFMQRLAEVLAFGEDTAPPAASAVLLQSAVFANALVTLGKTAIGQFNPGGIGGANGTQGRFEAGSQVNPWDFVLMIEGALLFAGSLARRQGPLSTWRAVFPFSVESVAVGYGSSTASEETTDGSRAELWLPLWEQSATLAEVRQLFAEGRAQLGKRQAGNAVEFALAVNLLGVNRGISSFTRYGFLKRNGLAFLAAPLGRIPVQRRPQARLLDDPELTKWLAQWRRGTSDKSRTPQRYQAALRGIDRAMFEFACRSEEASDASNRQRLTQILRELGQAERTLATGLRFADKNRLNPLQGLIANWLPQADDGSPEFRMAAALAGICSVKNGPGPLRIYLESVATTWSRKLERVVCKWSPGSCSAVWTTGTLEDNLAAVFQRRQLEAAQSGSRVVGVPLNSRCYAPLADVVAFLRGETNDEKLADLLWALCGVNWSNVPRREHEGDHQGVPFEFGVARLLVEPLKFGTGGEKWKISGSSKQRESASEALTASDDDDASQDQQPRTDRAKHDAGIFHALASGRDDAVSECVTRAARRHKSDGRLIVGYRNRQRSGQRLNAMSCIRPQRLLAAMLFPLSHSDISKIANAVLSPPESED